VTVRHVQTIFCDDIRHEINGKISYIGVYAGTMFVQVFPSTLPKLCIDIKVISPPDNPIKSLKLNILSDEKVLQEIDLSEEQLSQFSSTSNERIENGSKDFVQVANFQLLFSPLQLEAPCILKVRARMDGEEYKGLGLSVKEFPKQTETLKS
jgi:hypothetical protein